MRAAGAGRRLQARTLVRQQRISHSLRGGGQHGRGGGQVRLLQALHHVGFSHLAHQRVRQVRHQLGVRSLHAGHLARLVLIPQRSLRQGYAALWLSRAQAVCVQAFSQRCA